MSRILRGLKAKELVTQVFSNSRITTYMIAKKQQQKEVNSR